MKNLGKQKLHIKHERFMVPGKEQSLDDLISLAPLRGWVILQVDRANDRLLVGLEETEIA